MDTPGGDGVGRQVVEVTTIRAMVIADSVSPEGIRLTTMQLRYPYIIHAEFMTHRAFSRNASSARAIPIGRMIAQVQDDPFMPIRWGKNQPGMQADEEIDPLSIIDARDAWEQACEQAIMTAEDLGHLGIHKEIANRVLLPFMHMDVVVSSTDWQNFFTLRRHQDAEPHIRLLADRMEEALAWSTPVKLEPGEWHLPYITETDAATDKDTLIKQSVARCAWVSYTDPTGKKAAVEQEVALHDRLVVSQPLHATPAEHQATPDTKLFVPSKSPEGWDNPEWHGNFRGWIQYRKTLPGECVPG